MKEIKHFMLPEHTNELYKNEAISSISLTKEVASKINELVDAYNKLNQTNYEKIQEQDGKIAKGILYMKDNIKNTVEDLLDILEYSGELKEIIREQLFREILAEVKNKLDRGANESITMDMLSQEVKTAMTGGSVAVLGGASVNTTNIVDGAVTKAKLDNELAKTITKNNVELIGSLLNIEYSNNELVATIDRSYIYVQNPSGSPMYNIIPSKTYTLKDGNFLVLKMNTLTTDGTEVVPELVDVTFSRQKLFNEDYIILLSHNFGRVGGLFARNTLALSNSGDTVTDDKQVYLKVNNSNSITLLKKCSESDTSYLGINFNHTTDTTKNANVWRLTGIRKYTKSGSTFTSDTTQFVTDGEIESAIQISGASDFVGGSIHGYEEVTNLEIYIDGLLVDLSNVTTYSSNNITIMRESEMYDYGTKNVFAIHKCLYEFDNTGLTLSQNIEFKLAKNINRSYLGMFPVSRMLNNTYISSNGVFYPTLESVKLLAGHTNDGLRDATSVLLTNNESGHNFTAKMEVLEHKTPALKINISNADIYNKIYPAVCEATDSVKIGDVWSIKTKFTYEYKGLK